MSDLILLLQSRESYQHIWKEYYDTEDFLGDEEAFKSKYNLKWVVFLGKLLQINDFHSLQKKITG